MKSISSFTRLFRRNDPVIIIPFGGYAARNSIHSQARVLQDEGILRTGKIGPLGNFINTLKRFETDEIANAEVKVIFYDQEFLHVSDEEGYVYINEEIKHLTPHDNKITWLPMTYQVWMKSTLIHQASSRLMFPPESPVFGIISDLDDTILDTGLSSRFKHKVLVNTLFKQGSKRKPIQGMLELFNRLHYKHGQPCNPVFYLSNSPWNLHEYLIEFLNDKEFPEGPLMLRDVGLEHYGKKLHYTLRNKFQKITHILTTYPDFKFILIGDAHDLDPEIYLEAAEKFKNRILAIYIRAVKNEVKNMEARTLLKTYTLVPVKLFDDPAEVIDHLEQLKLFKD